MQARAVSGKNRSKKSMQILLDDRHRKPAKQGRAVVARPWSVVAA
jgi:hypothetical protein